MSHSLQQLREQLPECLLKDRRDFKRWIDKLSARAKQKQPIDKSLNKLAEVVSQSVLLRQQRMENNPELEYDALLPVVEKREEIARAIDENQVVIICGETGSGKTTQLPKICLGLGRGVDGLIGHTQPRRIAARSVAARIAEELKSELGSTVGFKVRFSDQVSERSRIKLMTDGILLAETQGDRYLNQYDTIIIDEAHERSLNIDFLLGYLKQLLPKRPDLKVIITSATIDPERFAKHFDDAPIINVSGRTYPVEIEYRPLMGEDEDERDKDLEQGILDAVDELHRHGPGDILIFLPGEREIRETAEALRKHHPPATEILPLFARLSAADQSKIFKPSGGKRRIVLATNVAETSLTVPGIRYVIDSGVARISRYSYRSKMQRLPIEAISQASANQRSGRCGRVAAGISIRLYSEDDFNSRSEFTDAEILRTNLASVILQMAALGLGDVSKFPFVDAPDDRLVKDGQRLLFELGAVDENFRLTELGRKLARLPIDPRLARMVIAAGDHGASKEVLIICAALSIQDPRERPMEKQQAADEKHRRFADESSDFVAYLNLWDYLQEQARHLSQNKLRALCKKEFISYVRYREWREVLGQLKKIAKELGLRENQTEADFGAIHRSLLTGLLGHVGLKQERNEFLGARNRHFYIFPGSGLFKKSPKWVMAAEIVETAQVFARVVAKIDPEWIEPMAAHLIKRNYFDPHWEKRAGQVAAFERVTLYGLPIVAKRKVNYGPIDPIESREIFIRHGLVTGELQTRAPFFKHNQQLIHEIENMEAKSRRQDIMVDDEVLAQFYEKHIPENVYSLKTFDKWRKQAEQKNPKLLFLTQQDLMRQDADHVSANRYPEQVSIAGHTFKLTYHFEPGSADDGVSLHVPLGLLSTLPESPLQWLVPGMLEEKLTLLIKSLPKTLRKNFVPAPQFAQACMQNLQRIDDEVLLEVFAHQLKRMTGVEVPLDQWQIQNLPPHLLMNICVHDEKGKIIASGRDLTDLRQRLKNKLDKSFEQLPENELEQRGLKTWKFGDLPSEVDIRQSGMAVKGYPAIIDEGDSVAIKVLGDPVEARQRHAQGLLRLFLLSAAKQAKYLSKNLSGIDRMCLQYSALGKCGDLKDDFVNASFREVFLPDSADIRSQSEFEKRLKEGAPKLVSMANDYCKVVGESLEAYHELNKKLKGRTSPLWLHALADIKSQTVNLIYEGFVWQTPWSWLQHLPRYLQAALRRIERLAGNEAKDRERMIAAQKLWDLYQSRASEKDNPELVEFRWMIEELRVSFFAQDLKTIKPVSEKRLQELWKIIPKN